MNTKYEIHGTTDEVTVCDCCGKKNLNTTVVLEVAEGNNAGELLHFGSHCATRAMGMRKSHADLLVIRAKRRAKMQVIFQAVKSAIGNGIEAARDAGKAAAKQNKIDASVVGFSSWGEVNIHYSGEMIVVKP